MTVLVNLETRLLEAIRNRSLFGGAGSFCFVEIEAGKGKKQKGSGFSSAAPWLIPSPRYFAKLTEC
jgi:hypothetical protein